jgi:hypothetical protein
MFSGWLSAPPPPCNNTMGCSNEGGRCWFSAVMTFIHKAHDQLPSAPLMPVAYAFSQQLALACQKKDRRVLMCKRPPKMLINAYRKALFNAETARDAVGSTLQKLFVHRPLFWFRLFTAAKQDRVLLYANVNRANGAVSIDFSFSNSTNQTFDASYPASIAHGLVTSKDLADADGPVPYFLPTPTGASYVFTKKPSGISFETLDVFTNVVIYEVLAGDLLPVPNGGYGKLLLGAIYDIASPVLFRNLPSVDAVQQLTAGKYGVAMVTFARSALVPYHNFVRFVDAVGKLPAVRGFRIVGGVISIVLPLGDHEI